LLWVVVRQIANEDVGIDRARGAAAPRRDARAHLRHSLWPGLIIAAPEHLPLGVVRANQRAGLRKTPGISPTLNRIPATQCRRFRMAAGRMTWPLVETVVVISGEPAMTNPQCGTGVR